MHPKMASSQEESIYTVDAGAGIFSRSEQSGLDLGWLNLKLANATAQSIGFGPVNCENMM